MGIQCRFQIADLRGGFRQTLLHAPLFGNVDDHKDNPDDLALRVALRGEPGRNVDFLSVCASAQTVIRRRVARHRLGPVVTGLRFVGADHKLLKEVTDDRPGGLAEETSHIVVDIQIAPLGIQARHASMDVAEDRTQLQLLVAQRTLGTLQQPIGLTHAITENAQVDEDVGADLEQVTKDDQKVIGSHVRGEAHLTGANQKAGGCEVVIALRFVSSCCPPPEMRRSDPVAQSDQTANGSPEGRHALPSDKESGQHVQMPSADEQEQGSAQQARDLPMPATTRKRQLGQHHPDA